MSSVNKCILVGNLCADPEIRHTQDGRPIANLRLATNESWKDKNTGERREKVEYHTIVVFNENTAKAVEKYLGKGDKIYCEGQLQTRKWTDRDGNERYNTEVVVPAYGGGITFLNTKGGSDDRTDRQSRGRDDRSDSRDSRRGWSDDRGSGSRGRSDQGQKDLYKNEDLDDEVPF